MPGPRRSESSKRNSARRHRGPRIDLAPLRQPSGKIITGSPSAATSISTAPPAIPSSLSGLRAPERSGSILKSIGGLVFRGSGSVQCEGQCPLLDRLLTALEGDEPDGVSIALMVRARPWMATGPRPQVLVVVAQMPHRSVIWCGSGSVVCDEVIRPSGSRILARGIPLRDRVLGAGHPPSAAIADRTPSRLAQVHKLARDRGAALRERGVTVDFAPVVDVTTQPDDDVIGDRSFGSDAAAVSRYAGAFAAGARGERRAAGRQALPRARPRDRRLARESGQLRHRSPSCARSTSSRTASCCAPRRPPSWSGTCPSPA